MNGSSSIPTGLHRSAQGCEARATLGNASPHFPQPQRGCSLPGGYNPVGVVIILADSPRVARGAQPWAESRCPVGANPCRTLAALRPGQPNRAFEVIRGKLAKDPDGQNEQWGLKCLP